MDLKELYLRIVPHKIRNIVDRFGYFTCFVNYLIHDKDTFKHQLSIVAICKNEGPYIREWIDYHRLVGVEHFYIYDNESDDNTRTVLSPYIETGIVTYHYVKNRLPCLKPQITVYKEAVKKYKNKTKWLAVIDLDEFIVPLSADTITAVLKQIENNYMKRRIFVSLGVHWVVYGYSGHYKKPQGLVMENYTKSAGPHKLIKSIVNPRTVIGFKNPHYAVHFWRLKGINENGKTIKKPPYENKDVSIEDIQKIRINHYFTKSYEEFIERTGKNRKLSEMEPYYQLDIPPFEIKNEEDEKKWIDRVCKFPDMYDMVMTKYVEELYSCTKITNTKN
jgi:hypothetical protein